LIGTGTVLAGRYRLDQRIASGGMGEVWQGFDRVLGRTVAVKLLREPSDEPDFADRFRAEARTMATISHPGVVEVYDFGDDPAAGMYLVMKYIDGESLANALARDGRLSVQATMRLVAETAEALQAAHDKGVTHRDVKPGNLLLRPDGSVVLTDFGIARSAGATRQTSAGSLLGTAGYIAPERANGQPATARSDIYSLGIVAYRCLAGRLPFVGDSLVELALRHAHDEPPPLPADVPRGVRAVVHRAMAKDPGERWPSGSVLAAAARRAAALAPPGRPVAPTRRQAAAPVEAGPGSGRRAGRGLLVTGAAVVLVAIVATIAVIGHRGGTSTQPPLSIPSSPDAIAGLGSATAGPAATTAPAGPHVTGTRAVAAATPLGAPANLTATPVGPNTIRLQWTDLSTEEDGFAVIDGITEKDVGRNATNYNWSGLLPDARSCFKVRAYNSSGVSAYEPPAQADWVCVNTLLGVGPPAPSDLTAKFVSTSTIHLEWTDNSADEIGFTIIDGQSSRNVPPNTHAYDWDLLAPNTYECFKIRSYRMSGVSAYFPSAEQDWVCTQLG
jgi:serine/threonine-protein kinase